jgi:6-phosphogluconolactonase
LDSNQIKRWHEFDNLSEFERSASRFILEKARHAIAARGAFSIVLAGGNTPRGIYRRLCQAPTNWSAWHIFFGDERCLPADDPQRNSHMARIELLDHVAIPSAQIHIIPAELGPDAAAHKYALDIAHIREFDLVLLGMGEDGHTASLFPGGAWEKAVTLPDVLPIHDAPKSPPRRVSVSPARLSRALCVMFLVSGKNKHDVVNKWRMHNDLPVSAIVPTGGVEVFLSR